MAWYLLKIRDSFTFYLSKVKRNYVAKVPDLFFQFTAFGTAHSDLHK
jgi:hypothetical protein